jgi:threonine/homoserine/homoserine lactone efflux protein
VGHFIIELPLVVILILSTGGLGKFSIGEGLGEFFKSPDTQMVIGFGGGLFLLFVSFQMLRDIKKVGVDEKALKSSGPIITGIMLSGSNPYFPLWWLSIGLNLLIRASELGAWALVLFTAVHWTCDLMWLQILSWASFKGAKVFGVKGQKIVLGICGTVLGIFGCVFLLGAGKILLG